MLNEFAHPNVDLLIEIAKEWVPGHESGLYGFVERGEVSHLALEELRQCRDYANSDSDQSRLTLVINYMEWVLQDRKYQELSA